MKPNLLGSEYTVVAIFEVDYYPIVDLRPFNFTAMCESSRSCYDIVSEDGPAARHSKVTEYCQSVIEIYQEIFHSSSKCRYRSPLSTTFKSSGLKSGVAPFFCDMLYLSPNRASSNPRTVSTSGNGKHSIRL